LVVAAVLVIAGATMGMMMVVAAAVRVVRTTTSRPSQCLITPLVPKSELHANGRTSQRCRRRNL
jgi:hypothetical protein